MSESLTIKKLRISFPAPGGGDIIAVDRVDLALYPGETLGLVGESGCGKTLTALATLSLLPGSARVRQGEILLDGENLLELSEGQLRKMRGNRIAMIFQEPMTSLNPVLRVGEQIVEAIRTHRKIRSGPARRLAIDLLERVGVRDASRRFFSYPHQLSGGQRQRVMIAMALSCSPQYLIADEPTTALDVTVQANILKLISSLRQRERMGILLVSHDLGVVARETTRLAVMYLGRIVEEGLTKEIFKNPLHPYTRALLRSVPRLGEGRRRLETIEGNVPPPQQRPPGCPFWPRCPKAIEGCRQGVPELKEYAPGHQAACIRIKELGHE